MVEIDNEKPRPHYFVCLPYLNLGDVKEIDLGFAKVWNFDNAKERFIPDKALREQVSKILGNYRMSYPYGMKGMKAYPPIHGIGLISTGVPTDQEINKVERQKINDARLILFISFLARHNTVTRNVNTGHGMASSENYAPVYFSAVPGSEHMTQHSGFVIPKWHGGIDVDKNMVIRTWHVNSPNFDIEKGLFTALVQLRKKQNRIFRRIISAIEVFFESYYNAPEVSHNARILLQASAFEILFSTKTGQGRKELKNFLKTHANYPEDRKHRYASERPGGKVIEIGTKKEIWADRFFTLRNHITHGHLPAEKEYYFGDWQSHFDIGFYFFIFCIKRKIEEALKKQLFDDDVVWKTWVDDLQVPAQTYMGFEYSGYGRRAWERMMLKIRKKQKHTS